MAKESGTTFMDLTPHIPVGRLAVWQHRVDSPKARVLIIHGLSEHSGRHLNTVRYLNSLNFEVVRFDLRGAGYSGGKRQWIESFEDYIEDTTEIYNWIARETSALPLFVLGHSLGGAIAIHFASRYNSTLAGLILSAPAYLLGGGISPIKVKIGQWLVRVTPTLRLPKSTTANLISKDAVIVKVYENDPLSCHFNTLQQGDAIIKTLVDLPKCFSHITIPTLIVHGSSDQIIRLEGSFEMLKKLHSTPKELFIVPGGFHELHNEIDSDRESYFTRLGQWLNKH